MQFEDRIYLWLFLLLPLLTALFYLYLRWRKKAIAALGETALVEELMPRQSVKRKWMRLLILLCTFAAVIVAMANLRAGSKKEKIHGESADVIICFDVSNSMLAQDVKPDRLTQAKITASQLIEKLAGNRISLIVFAGKSFVQMPLTGDARAALMYLNTINTDMIGAQGTAIGGALETALNEFEQGGEEGKGKAIIIITDGESHDENAPDMAKSAAKENIRIITLGVGTGTGAPIPTKRGGNTTGYKKDREGNIVLTKLDEQMLRSLSESSNGVYMNIAEGRKVIQKVYNEVDALDKTKDNTYTFTEYANHFQIFLGMALLGMSIWFILSDKKPKWLEKINIFDAEK
ncbi:MAG: VWA domain-containing protein [Chitinophagales bacterium]